MNQEEKNQRSKSRRRLAGPLGAVACLILALGLVACGSDDESDSGGMTAAR